MYLFYFVLLCVAVPCLTARCDREARKHFEDCPKKETHVQVGKSVVLPCKTKREFTHCMWKKKNSQHIQPGKGQEGHMVDYIRVNDSPKDCSVRISNVTREDLGPWDCVPGLKDTSSPPTVVTVLVAASHRRNDISAAPGTPSHADMLRVELMLLCVIWLVSSILS